MAYEILSRQKKYKSFQTFLENFEDEDEGAFVNKSPSLPETNDKEKRIKTKDLLTLASKIEAFSYLSSDALAEVLEYAEYVDFKDVGDVVFDTETNTLDGSMYAVISGEVTTSLSIQDLNHDRVYNRDSVSNLNFSFVAGPGEVITSLLTLISSLVREYQVHDTSILLYELAGVLGGGTITDRHDSTAFNSFNFVPPGMNVKATGMIYQFIFALMHTCG